LGRTCADQGKDAAAEAYYRRGLVIMERVFGREHINYAAALSNLARLRRAQKLWPEAERLCLEALAIVEHAFGQEHPLLAGYLSEYRRVLDATDRKKEARAIAARIRDIETLAGAGPERHTVDLRELEGN
jgi:tetratricopeptide (TPR) repeat protein